MQCLFHNIFRNVPNNISEYTLETSNANVMFVVKCLVSYNIQYIKVYPLRIHTTDKPYKCDNFGKGFITAGSLQNTR